jgi:glucose-6-phosphate isomerase
VDIDAFIEGAAAMDRVTREPELRNNPAALLAAMWHFAGNGRGDREMVVLPYKDRLLLFSRYLQQLVMESLGKEKNLAGETVHQGLTVFGNKGSTDQHAYVQQLRDGRDDFFVTFIEVLMDREGSSVMVEENATSGDFLLGFLLGTRRALHESGRGSMTLTLPDAGPHSLGMLIALYERAVGLYASLVGINAYHQPGVEAGKKAAEEVLALQIRALDKLRSEPGRGWTTQDLAAAMGAPGEVETLFQVLDHLAANPDHGIRREARGKPWEAIYRSEAGGQ